MLVGISNTNELSKSVEKVSPMYEHDSDVVKQIYLWRVLRISKTNLECFVSKHKDNKSSRYYYSASVLDNLLQAIK